MSADGITELAAAVAELGALPMPVPVVPEPPSAERLAEIAARADAATAGPWCTDAWEIYQGAEYVPGISFWIGETCRGTSELGQDRADAAFVAAARSDVPELVAEVRRLRVERAEIGNEIARFGIFGAALPAAKALVKRADELVTENGALRARLAESEAERHSANEALDDAVQALRADLAMVCRVCEAPVRWVDSPTGGWWNHVTPTEDGHGLTPKPVFVPRTERSYWVAIADALNAAHSAGMPVGIDLDGTLTDHNAWSVVWDRSADRWAVAGYEDGFPAPDAAARKTFAERAARESDSGRRAAWRMLAQDVTDGEHYGSVHHSYRLGHDLPETGGLQ